MKIIEPSFKIITELNRDEILNHLEKTGRTCYQSQDKITSDSAEKFVTNIVKRKHLAMIEFFDIQVKFIHNRGFCYEMVRHRLCSFAQESTRYCSYKDEITVIEPYWYPDGSEGPDTQHTPIVWVTAMRQAEESYLTLLQEGLPPQAARGVLPIDVKTEIVVKANLREWLHIFHLRCAEAAHPDMRRVMLPLQRKFREILPEIFGELPL